ncbi:haloacid dehalogenase [candidate division KSB1 bacterium RBG_16_48_16]|nr:MAG: haloacid dehalogenase [candidate division KSB1 bacterium RBG_16_48_16]
MSDPQAVLRNLQPKHKFLIAIDSDGCAFDTMEIKHKECFIPNIIKHWRLQPVSKYARAAAEFVNLYSKWRGVNRFPALTMTFDLLKEWPDVQKRKVEIPQARSLRDWIAGETRLGNPALKSAAEKTNDPVLKQALAWSEEVNKTIEEMVFGVPPFPHVRESLGKISDWADVIVCSATPNEALEREWEEHDIAQYARVIAGQERGSKKEHIHLASQGKYESSKVLMIGDAPGDLKAARANDAKFFPVRPGHEDESWEFFFAEAADKFERGHYTAEYEAKLIEEFEKLLPEVPPWKK